MNATDPSPADDVAAIERIIGDVEAGFNAKDAGRSVAHFADDATATSATGVRVAGREALNRPGFCGGYEMPWVPWSRLVGLHAAVTG